MHAELAGDQPAYRRILLKLGGEALAGPEGFGIDPLRAEAVTGNVKRVMDLGVQVAIVIGAGNLWWGGGRGTRTSPPIRLLHCGRWRSTPISSSKRPRSMVSTSRIPRLTPRPGDSTG